jgi:hypothetical protein
MKKPHKIVETHEITHFDKDGNEIYHEILDDDGFLFWEKREYDKKGILTYYESSGGALEVRLASDGEYSLYVFRGHKGGTLEFNAGCRYFTRKNALKHWTSVFSSPHIYYDEIVRRNRALLFTLAIRSLKW